MSDDLPALTPYARVLLAIEAFYEVYRSELPHLTHRQLHTIYQQLAFYAHEIDDEASRKPRSGDTPN